MAETKKATRALGTKFKKGNVAIANLTSISGIEITADTIDVTTLDSLGGYKEFINGFKDAGEVGIEGYFDASEGQMSFQGSIDTGTAEAYTIEFPPMLGASWQFDGIVTNFKVGDAEMDGTIAFGATIKISGKPTLTLITGE